MSLHPAIDKIIRDRCGIYQGDYVEFISQKPQKMYDPFLLPDMEEGVDLILDAIENDKKICIYGDYDADGVTATVLLYSMLKKLTNNLLYYIPSRFDEGYGLNVDAIDKIHANKVDLVITVDCGSSSYEEVEYGKALGLEFLVTDHHRIPDKTVDALLINPMRKDSKYPINFLSGVGVAFKLAQALGDATGIDKKFLISLLDLVAVGTIGDVVPLLDENRTLVKYGLRTIKLGQRESLKALVEAVGLGEKENITSTDISFKIVPYINAAGRMDNAYGASKLLLSTKEDVIEKRVKNLIECNEKRKAVQQDVLKQANHAISLGDGKAKKSSILAIKLEDAHEGITGIVAGRLKDIYNKPTLIMTSIDAYHYKGTGRSIEGVNLYELLNCARNSFVKFGGHKAACGFTIEKDNVKEMLRTVKEKLEDMVSENPEIMARNISYDVELFGRDVNLDFVEDQKVLEPFGKDNEKPRIKISGKVENLRAVGNNGQYLSFLLNLDGHNRISCILFSRCGEFAPILESQCEVSLIGELDINQFRGKSSVQMMVLDVQGKGNFDGI